MARGGKREGSGRKQGEKTKLAQLYNAKLAELVEKEKLPIIEALIAKAKTGDVQAIKEIHDRLMGKAEQPLTGVPGKPIEVTWKSKSTTSRATGPKVSITA